VLSSYDSFSIKSIDFEVNSNQQRILKKEEAYI